MSGWECQFYCRKASASVGAFSFGKQGWDGLDDDLPSAVIPVKGCCDLAIHFIDNVQQLCYLNLG